MANARNIKIPDSDGTLVSYPIEETINRRTRRNITSDLANLSKAVLEQNLKKYGYDVGDYFNGPSGYEYILADLNTFKGSSNNYGAISKNHITILVRTGESTKWNESADTSTGYVASNLHTYLVNTVLPKVKTDINSLFGDWSSHLISHSKLYRTNNNKWGWGWSNDQYICALTSVQMHGSPICDMDGTDTGEGNKPLAVFQKYFYCDVLRNITVWLRSISASRYPCLADNRGSADGRGSATDSYGVLGLIVFN